MSEKLTGADVEELEALQELVGTMGWRIFKNILNKHRIHCLDTSHQCLKKHEDREAGEWLAKSGEGQTILNMIQTRKQELSTKQEGKE